MLSESETESEFEEVAVSTEEIQIELDIEEEAVSETEEAENNHYNIEEQDNEKDDEHEVEQELQGGEASQTANTKKRSWVWDFFTYDKTMKKARCVHCKVLIACDKGSTSGMATHINSKHKLLKGKEKKQLTIDETFNNSELIVSIIFISL
jgi:hypothetical protein